MTKIYFIPRYNDDLEEMLESYYWLCEAWRLGLQIKVNKNYNYDEKAIYLGSNANIRAQILGGLKNAIYPHMQSVSLSQRELPRTQIYRKWLNRNYDFVTYDKGITGVIKAAFNFNGDVFIKNQSAGKDEGFKFFCHCKDENAIWNGIGYSLERHSDDILIYDFVKMELETRFIVIDQKVVSGSVNKPELTPLNNPEGDKYFQCDNELIKSANNIALDFADALPQMRDYVLDLCFIDSKPSIVEVNPAMSFGLFGNHPKNILPEILGLANVSPRPHP
jgi:hypothetical protein